MPFKKYYFGGQEAKSLADEIRNNYKEHFLLVYIGLASWCLEIYKGA